MFQDDESIVEVGRYVIVHMSWNFANMEHKQRVQISLL